MMEHFLIVIPARLQSFRLKRKPLQDLCGKPLIVRVYENLMPLARSGAQLLVASDSEEVLAVCREHQIDAVLTRKDHQSGTDRCAEVASGNSRPFVLNVQGDEPFVKAEDLMNLAMIFKNQQNVSIATLRYLCHDRKKMMDSNIVKVVSNHEKKALYFSRAPVPFLRDGQGSASLPFYQHLGVYAYEKSALLRFCSLPVGELEQIEKLEQLRALEHGLSIHLVDATQSGLGVDTEQDLQEARKIWMKLQGDS